MLPILDFDLQDPDTLHFSFDISISNDYSYYYRLDGWGRVMITTSDRDKVEPAMAPCLVNSM